MQLTSFEHQPFARLLSCRVPFYMVFDFWWHNPVALWCPFFPFFGQGYQKKDALAFPWLLGIRDKVLANDGRPSLPRSPVGPWPATYALASSKASKTGPGLGWFGCPVGDQKENRNPCWGPSPYFDQRKFVVLIFVFVAALLMDEMLIAIEIAVARPRSICLRQFGRKVTPFTPEHFSSSE